MVKKIKNLGINVSLEFSSDTGKIVKYLNELKVEWIRLEFNFFSWLNNKFELDLYEKFIEDCRKSGIKVLGLITGTVPGNLANVFYPALRYAHIFEKIENYLEFIEALSERFKKSIFHWEIWNEQNTRRFWIKNPDAEEYIRLLSMSSEKIRGNIPEAKILFGGIAGNDQYKGIVGLRYGFFKECIEKNASDFFDISNFHPYDLSCYISIKGKEDSLKDYVKNFSFVFDYSRRLADKPTWITEFGISRKFVKLNEGEIADIYHRLYLSCMKNNSVFFIWNLIGPFGNDYGFLNPETGFSFLDRDAKPNKMFIEMKKKFSLL